MKKLTAIITTLLIICSSLMVVTVPAIADTGTKLTNLYNEEYHDWHVKTSGKEVAFDADNKVITMTGGQAKTLVNYSDDMTEFDASVIIQGNTIEKSTNANYGLIYGGIIFHINKTDFNKAFSFDTTGYSVILKREKNSTTATVIVRYITNNSKKKELTFKANNVPSAYDAKFKLNVSVDTQDFVITLTDATGSVTYKTETYPLDNTSLYPTTACYESGAIGLLSNGYHKYFNFEVTANAPMANIPPEDSSSGGDNAQDKALKEKYNLYADNAFTTGADKYTTLNTTVNSRGILKSGSKADFSTELTIKLNGDGETKTGIIFRASNVGVGINNMQGYAAIVDTTKTDAPLKLYLYKYGPENGSSANDYIGSIGVIDVGQITPAKDMELVLHLNVSGKKAQAYVYKKSDPSVKSDTLVGSLDKSFSSAAIGYYQSGDIGFYIGYVQNADYYVNALDGLVINDATEIEPGGGQTQTGRPAVDKSKGNAVKGNSSSVKNVTASNAGAVGDLASYVKDWDNYTFYSSSTTNKLMVTKEGIVSKTAGTKRAMLDGVTVSGFHSVVSMKVTEEGTMRSGIVFRVNDIEKGTMEDGSLPANNIEGYAAILYKTPGNTGNYSRVVMCIYKYGIVDGEYMFLGTVASKASMVPLSGYEKTEAAAAGQELVMDVNVIDDQITVCFYNKNKPELVSEKLIADLKDETDVEGNTPSIKGVQYKKGAIGLTTTNQGIFTSFSVSEPEYPSTDVGDLSNLDSYTLYGSGAMQEGEYITSNSSGTKKLIVNNLTVKDFKASMDMTIDENGNLKTGMFFRVNEVGNGADDQTGWAIVVTRNYATNGETNPNRIDIVLFKWGYSKGKLSYLGEVSREVYKSGNSFVDGKMAGEELTFVVSVMGAGIDATLYHKKNPTNKPVTFSTNLKFAGKNEKETPAYFESGGIGIYLGNSVSDPVNYNRVRNFHIDDGSGVEIKNVPVKTNASGVATILGIPLTGESILVMIIAAVFIISAGVMLTAYYCNKRGKRIIGDTDK